MGRTVIVIAALAAALAFTACGGSDEPDRPEKAASLLLDFQPNAIHAGIYSAVARGFAGAEGVELGIEAPTQSTDATKLLDSGRVDFAILDIHDLALAQQEGAALVGIMALVQQPLAALLAQPGVRRPRDLAGRRVGVAGLPSDDAVLESIVAGDGGDPDAVRKVTIGFNAVPSLLGGRVAAATAFWNAEGVALRRELPDLQEFRVEDYGAPAYPELVLTTSQALLDDEPALARATIAALARGYALTIDDPESSISDLLAAEPGLERDLVREELQAVSPAFTAGVDRFGLLDEERLQAWARWEHEFGITEQPPDITTGFDTAIAARATSG